MTKPPSLMARALALLARREHTLYELQQKLSPHAQSEQELQHVLQQLKDKQLQSDQRFCESFVQSRSHKWGQQKILHHLRQYHAQQVDLDAIHDTLQATEYQRAHQIWAKKFKNTYPTDAKTFAKQARFLASRGFQSPIIYQVLKHQEDDFAC